MSGPLTELAVVFLRLGITSFGGPAAHTAMMEDELVVRRRWLTHEHFLDLVGATNLIPGPNSTEMTMHIGLDRAGGWGMLVAGTSFILPAALITGFLASLYVRYGALPQVEQLLAGVRPVVLVIILTAIVRLGQKAAKSWPRMRASPWMSSFLDAINASAIGLMAIVLVQMSRSALTSWQAVLIAVVAAIVLWRWKVNSAWLIAGGGLAGWFLLKL